MFEPEEDNGDEIIGIGYRDVLMNMLGILLTMLIVMLLMISEENNKKKASAEPPGNLIVHIVWPVGNVDVDLWVNGPGEPVPVGYSNKGGMVWNLLRDDLGDVIDLSGINYEDAYTRGVIPGEYTINVQCYRCLTGPVEVQLELSINTGENSKGMQVLLRTMVKLFKNGQERTAINFYLEKDGTIRQGSVNSVFRPLRDGSK